ncbi:c-type cytochrome [Sinorhizobium meliloti]|uniref:c-type cytochrome n=1 Tax=Rhizobium meliloti TaxID=382 RepID=UPI000B4A1D89|nr:cytochrome c [Sinorhizobium meliloti]MDX0986054.1 c-type cytochrome [Sinorhizobium medicae]ASQ14961.1 cytochrome C [Sinorhizobium meliloti]MDX1066796.1 c-type cytochrome [Sinorhizobium medicae]MQU69502.1 c-type cytochrome [Sinorhizobium meliloti]MQU81267.1 c-type cytochrome [Sinorhizobium meliloti]
MKMAPVLFLALGGVATALALTWFWLDERRADEVRLGRMLYSKRCASCHGVKLEGQPDWKSPLPTGKMPAPPHDASGHTWHHPDGLLFRITRDGPAAIVGSGYKSDMPSFGGVLSNEEIRAVQAFIKSTWPERERVYQEEMTRRERTGS